MLPLERRRSAAVEFKVVSRRDFWSDADHWPREGPIYGIGATFIARGFNLIGQHIFRDAWLGVEGFAEPVEKLPENQFQASAYQIRLVETVLSDRYPEFRGVMPFPRTAGGLGSLGGMPAALVPPERLPLYQPYHDDDWAAARQIFADAHAQIQPAVNRRAEVAEWLAVHINDKLKLRVMLADIRTGKPEWGDPAHWNQRWQRLENRWRRGTYYVNDPFAPVIDGPALGGRECQIFVVEDELFALLNDRALPGPVAPAPNSAPPVVNETVRLTAAMFNLHTALIAEFGDTGGLDTQTVANRAQAAEGWRAKQPAPKPMLPGEVARSVRRLDEKVFSSRKPLHVLKK
jgi:hypothetical protein